MKVFWTYLLVQLSGWLLVAIVAGALYGAGALGAGGAFAVFAAWVAKDLLAFPVMRRYYQPQPAEARIIGETGTAVTDLSPGGFVRVHGELWQARARSPIAHGARIRVCGIRGLTVDVDRAG
jgi:membrane-bound serine protease (ClpP class)